MSEDAQLTILFADVVGSTQLFEQLGDTKARDMVGRCIEIMRVATESHDGKVIKTIGDEVMATFANADDAISAAREMHDNIAAADDLSHDRGHVAIRVGCHFGSVVEEEGDVFGGAVHTANRMTSQAKAHQILTTLATVNELTPVWRSMAREIDIATVRGKAEEVVLFEIVWQPDEATSMLPRVPLPRDKAQRVLILRCQGGEVRLGDGRRTATLGRAEENDVVVKGNLISRVHAKVEASRDRFMLVDQSTNGTYIQTDDGDEIFVRRDSAVLTGEGVIGLGRPEDIGNDRAIRYVIEE
ncbi:MAG TPA: adenylate/guanylate cyclase domain-containing protein [Gammaproteobacteria bacterium]